LTVRFQRLLQDGLLASAEAHPTKVVVSAEDGNATFAELLTGSLGVAAALQDEGLERGDRAAVFMENSLACATTIFGILLAGGTFVMVNAQTKDDRLTYILDDSGAKFLFGEGPLARIAVSAHDAAASPPKLVFARAPEDVESEGADLATMTEGESEPRPGRAIPPDLAALLYTSGSTGTPKGVMLTHQSLTFATESIADYLRMTADDRVLNVLPLAFGYGLSQLLLTARLGATLVLERSFAYPAKTLQRLEANEATIFPGIPTIFATLTSLFGGSEKTYPSVRAITNAAAGLPPSLHAPLRELFPNALIFRMYGQTECIRVCYLKPELVDEKPTSVGKAIPGTETVVLDEDGRPAAPGVIGTLYVRGPHVMRGYWNAPELTATTVSDQLYPGDAVLCTHDLFTTDADGDLYFVSRSDEIIKTRGEKVSPIQVENVLFTITGIKEAAVVGVPDELLGEAIRAYVVREEGSSVEEADVVRACREQLEAFAVPHDVRFIEELPKTPSGKVRRKSLLT
jgi:acyl-CoA synthetase (AMP-forming)/AMP-acid ligase II